MNESPEAKLQRVKNSVINAEAALAKARNLLAEVEVAERYLPPTEPEWDFSVIGFSKRYASSSEYHYCAIRFSNVWYVSGPRHGGQALTWHQLMEFIGRDYWDSIQLLRQGKDQF